MFTAVLTFFQLPTFDKEIKLKKIICPQNYAK